MINSTRRQRASKCSGNEGNLKLFNKENVVKTATHLPCVKVKTESHMLLPPPFLFLFCFPGIHLNTLVYYAGDVTKLGFMKTVAPSSNTLSEPNFLSESPLLRQTVKE